MDALADRSGSRRAWPQAPIPPIPPVPPVPPMPPSPKLIFGETGPFGPEGVFGQKGVFGAKGPFGPGGVFGDRRKESWREDQRSRGSIQGWVR
jgi:hypothetical protein